MHDNCKVCDGTGSMVGQHPETGEEIWLDCWCTDEVLYSTPPQGTNPGNQYVEAIDLAVPSVTRLKTAMQALSNVMIWATLEAEASRRRAIFNREAAFGYAASGDWFNLGVREGRPS